MVSNDLKQKQKKAERLRRETKNDLMVNRSAIVFVLAFLGVLAMLVAKKSIDSEVAFISYWLTPLLIISAAALAGAIVLFVKRKKTDDSDRVITKWNVLGAAVVFFGAMLVYRLTFDATLVVLGLISAGILYFVFGIFGLDFFIYSVMTALGVLLFRMCATEFYSSFGKAVTLLGKILCLVVAAAGLVLAILHISGKGTIGKGQKKLVIGGIAVPMIIAAVFLVAGGIVAFAAPAVLTYVLAAMLVVYVITTIAYVLKMM